MATIVVEDGTIISGANSYASEAELTTYATDRGKTLTGTAAVLLIQAMDYIEQQDFKGDKKTKDQALQWPRYNVWIDGFEVDSTAIPQLLKDAQMEAALTFDAGTDPLSTVSRETKREKIDGLEVEYKDSASWAPVNRALSNKLQKLTKSGAFGVGSALRV